MKTPMRLAILALTNFFLLFSASLSIADVERPVRHIEELVDPVVETVYRVSSAKIILADYDLIRKDFAITRNMTEMEIDRWLLAQTAFMSEVQVRQTLVNNQIPLEKDKDNKEINRKAYRPQLYGRALVFEVDDGLIDAKGVGAYQQPARGSHKNGLASLGEVIREFLFQKKVQQILDHSGSGLRTVGSYAVIDWGFLGYDAGSIVPAGAILRQGHARPRIFNYGNHFANNVDSKRIEDLFRHYGLTSTGDSDPKGPDRVNIQQTSKGELIDFGAYLFKKQFHAPTTHYMNASILGHPDHPPFVQPDPRMSIGHSYWGSSETSKEHPRFDNAWVWSHRLAQDLYEGKAQREHVTEHFKNMMSSGLLPPEAKDFAQDFNTPKNLKQAALNLVHLNTKFGQGLNVDLIKEYFEVASESEKLKVTLTVLDGIAKSDWASFYVESILKLLHQHNSLDKHPQILEKIVSLGVRWENTFLLRILLDAKREDLIKKLVNSKKIWPPALEEFLKNEHVPLSLKRQLIQAPLCSKVF